MWRPAVEPNYNLRKSIALDHRAGLAPTPNGQPVSLAQLRAGLPAPGNPANRRKPVSLTSKEFRFGFGNALTQEESDALFERWTIPSPARPLFEAAVANFSGHSPAKVDTETRSEDRSCSSQERKITPGPTR